MLLSLGTFVKMLKELRRFDCLIENVFEEVAWGGKREKVLLNYQI